MAERKSRKGARPDEQYPVLRELKAQMGQETLTRYGAHGIGISRKRKKGRSTGELAITFYVSAKRAAEDLADFEQIPESIEFRTAKDGKVHTIVTDVRVTPPAMFEAIDPEDRHRPVMGGVSGGINGSTGTLGGWVWDSTDDTIVVVSNVHVLGSTVGTDVLQQGTADGGSLPSDKIGDVKRGIPRTTTGTNTVDCAIAEPDDSSIYDLRVEEIGPAVFATEAAVDEMEVEKYGQTTEHTFGTVSDVDWSGNVSNSAGQLFFFDDCIFIDVRAPSADWSAGGDSGSLVFREEPEPDSTIKPAVGLHFAGSGTSGIACKIGSVFNQLDLTNLCSGMLSAFLDNLAASEAESETEREPDTWAEATLTAKERRRKPRPPLTRGLARDVEQRLTRSKKGRDLNAIIRSHRGELVSMLARRGDVRRATNAALRPILAGSVTTDDVLGRLVDKEDVARFDALAAEVDRHGSDELRKAVEPLRSLTKRAAGRTVGQVFGIRD